jgi:hypothetical protein
MEDDVTATLGDSPDADAQAEIARAELDRIVLLVETRPLAPRELRQRNPIDYGKLNKGIRRTTSDAALSSSSNPQADALGVTSPGPPPEASGPLNAWLALQMELLEKDDNIDQQKMEDTVARIFRLSEMLETPHSPEAAEAMRNAFNDDSLSLKAALRRLIPESHPRGSTRQPHTRHENARGDIAGSMGTYGAIHLHSHCAQV